MTNPTLERAARAAADAHAISKDGSRLYADYRETYHDIARAVLMAVRELPDGFIPQRRNLFHISEYLDHDFTAMIDAILNDGEGE